MAGALDLRYKFSGDVRIDGSGASASFEKCTGDPLSDAISLAAIVTVSEEDCKAMVRGGMRQDATKNDRSNKEDARKALAAIRRKRESARQPRHGTADTEGSALFSDDVLVCPFILNEIYLPYFTSSLPISEYGHYDRIDRKAILNVYRLTLGRWPFRRQLEIPIFSPASGLLINWSVSNLYDAEDNFFLEPLGYTNTIFNVKILLLDGASPPPDASEMFGRFCDLLYEHREEIFLKPRAPMIRASEAHILRAIERQSRAPFRLMSLRRDLKPSYEELSKMGVI